MRVEGAHWKLHVGAIVCIDGKYFHMVWLHVAAFFVYILDMCCSYRQARSALLVGRWCCDHSKAKINTLLFNDPELEFCARSAGDSRIPAVNSDFHMTILHIAQLLPGCRYLQSFIVYLNRMNATYTFTAYVHISQWDNHVNRLARRKNSPHRPYNFIVRIVPSNHRTESPVESPVCRTFNATRRGCKKHLLWNRYPSVVQGLSVSFHGRFHGCQCVSRCSYGSLRR